MARAEARLADYTNAAERITKRAGPTPYIISMSFAALNFASISLAETSQKMWDSILGLLVTVFFLVIPCVIYITRKNKKAERSLAETAETRPGFLEFYKSYLERKADEDLAWKKHAFNELLLNLTVGVLHDATKGIAKSTTDMLRDATKPAESGVELRLRNIENKLDKK